jgi:hypothetical protein
MSYVGSRTKLDDEQRLEWDGLDDDLWWTVLVGSSRPRRCRGRVDIRCRAAPWLNYPALELLEQRYARGEINREEYLEKKGDMLRPGGAAPAP